MIINQYQIIFSVFITLNHMIYFPFFFQLGLWTGEEARVSPVSSGPCGQKT